MRMEVIQTHENDLQRMREILNEYIGTKTASSLSMLLGESVTHRVRRIVETDSFDLESIIPVFDIIPMCSVYLKGEGDIHVGLLFFLPASMAKKFAAKMLGVKTMKRLSSLGRSSIAEAGNMMAGSFFNALSDGTGFRVDMSTPGFAADKFKALLESPASELANVSERLVIAEAELHGVDSDIIVEILILLSPLEAKKLLSAQK